MAPELAEADFPQWSERLRRGERRALARLLTFAESTRRDHARLSSDFLAFVGEPDEPALRLGVTGIPGAGKSSLIDVLGSEWVRRGHHVAVLAVDPSSVRSGGSVLGDKVRMVRLAASSSAFIRPVPSGGALGGVTAHLDECARLCELAGYDRIVIETVGVGQSEVDVALLCDALSVVAVPGTGDELQAFKRGVTEFADVLVLNKTDQLSEANVQTLLAMYEEGLGLVRGRATSVLACSAVSGRGIGEWLDVLEDKARSPVVPRREKRAALFRRVVEHTLLQRCWAHAEFSRVFEEVAARVSTERLTLRHAVERVLETVFPVSATQGNRA